MKPGMAGKTGLAWLLAALVVCGGQAAAQEAAAPSISLELNSLQPAQGSCRLTFVAANNLGAPLSKVAYEVALFDGKGLVDRLTVLDFRLLPEGKTKVRQFDLPETNCADIGRVLINDATACEGEGIEPADCIRKLETSTRTKLDFGT